MDANLIFFYLQVGEFSIIIVADFSVDKNNLQLSLTVTWMY